MPLRTPAGLRETIRRRAAQELGLPLTGFAPVEALPHLEHLSRWLADGYAGEMSYLNGSARRADPRTLLAEARSAIVVALPTLGGEGELAPERVTPGRGLVARFARRFDYHTDLQRRLRRLAGMIAEEIAGALRFAIAVDTAPLLERELAMAAGIGFLGKSTMLIATGLGSHVVLGTLLVDLPLPPDPPAQPRCGRCRRCLDACPTGALSDPYRVDARRCISYLTIEHRGAIDGELRPLLAPWVFGCDLCQEACPHNHRRAARRASLTPPAGAPGPSLGSLDLQDLLELSSTGYRRLVRGRALRRVDRAQLIRNAALCAGGERIARGEISPHLVSALEQVASSLSHPIAAEAACWALDRARSPR